MHRLAVANADGLADTIEQGAIWRQLQLRLVLVQPPHAVELRQGCAIALPQRTDHAAGRGNPGYPEKLADDLLDIILRHEDRVGVEDKLDIALEVAGLDFQARSFADRTPVPNNADRETVGGSKCLDNSHGVVLAGIVDDGHRARLYRLPHDRGKTQRDGGALIVCRDHDVDVEFSDCGRIRKPNRLGPPQMPDQRQHGTGAHDQ